MFNQPGSGQAMALSRKLPPRYQFLRDSEGLWQSHVRVTALLRPDGTVVPCDRPSFPKLRRDSMVDLVISADDLADEKERLDLTARREVVLFNAGAELRVRISSRHLTENDKAGFLVPMLNGVFPRPGYFAPITLKSRLSLVIRPNGRSSLTDVETWLPSVRKAAGSLNEAYRLLSERFEPGRRSRGGNVFLNVHYEDEGTWLALDALRGWCEAGMSIPWIR